MSVSHSQELRIPQFDLFTTFLNVTQCHDINIEERIKHKGGPPRENSLLDNGAGGAINNLIKKYT